MRKAAKGEEMKIRTNPCSECPFTNKSMRGYFGPYDNVIQLMQVGTGDLGYPCHMEDRSTLCTGAVGFMANIHKLPRAGPAKNVVKRTEPGTYPTVFKNGQDMMAHHDLKALKPKKRKKSKSRRKAVKV